MGHLRTLLFAAAALTVATAGSEEHEHPWEWIGVFEMHEGTFGWTASKVDEAYADPAMKIVFLEINQTDVDAGTISEEVEHMAEELFEGNCTERYVGPDIEVPSQECHQLIFDQDVYSSIFTLVVHHDEEEEEEEGDDPHDHEGEIFVAVFAEHFPIEFEADVHYLKDDHGHDVEPLYEITEEGDDDDDDNNDNRRKKAWRRSMIGSFIVLCCTIVGALLRLPNLWGEQRFNAVLLSPIFTNCMAALAAGALFSCAVYLMLFEAVHLTDARWSEVHATWRYGTMVMIGYGSGVFFQYFFEEEGHHLGWIYSTRRGRKKMTKEIEDNDEEDKAVEVRAAKEQEKIEDAIEIEDQKIRWDLVFSISIGDWLHNFVDGIVIAQAFLDCKVSKGWTVVAATVYHELAQEVSDFALLVNVAGLSVIPALLINVFAGVSVILGAAAYMWTKPGPGGQGMLLAFAAGLYIYLATNVSAHAFLDTTVKRSLQFKFTILIFFIVGCVAIGLVLIDHEHCEAKDGGGGGGGGHAHRLLL